jgi:hypothetical protein
MKLRLPIVIAPLVSTRLPSGAAGVSHWMAPVRASSATMWALLAGRKILSPAMAMLRMPP